MRTILGAVVGVAAGLTLAACSGTDGTATTVTDTAAATGTTGTASGAGPAPSSGPAAGGAGGAGSAGATVGAPADPRDFTNGNGVYFASPTRNIMCGLNADFAGCQVFRAEVLPPGANCVNSTFTIAQLSKGYLSQRGGPFLPSCFNQGVFFMNEHQRALPYGSTLTANGITCAMATAGVTCERRDGRGFFASAQSFRAW